MGVAIAIDPFQVVQLNMRLSLGFPYQAPPASKVIVYFFLQIHHVGISPISWSIPSLLGVPRDSGGMYQIDLPVQDAKTQLKINKVEPQEWRFLKQ